MQTSYAFIASYKQRIQALDRGIQNQDKARQQGQRPQQDQRPNTNVVEHRKLVQRFRQFLAEEEKFWTQLIVRLHRSFALVEATPTLIALGILSEAEEAIVNHPNGSDTADGVSNLGGRNHFQFPPEDASSSLVPTATEDKESRLAILTKAVICLGDIARYRELYNESGGRPKAGQEESVPARRPRPRRGGQSMADLIPRPRDYHRALQCYERARLLMPHDGNPFHQLAIIAFYQKNSFVSLFHYYRALCVRQPYDTASENLDSVLTRGLDHWFTNRSRQDRASPKELHPRLRVEIFKDRVVALHASWRVGKKDLHMYVGPSPSTLISNRAQDPGQNT
jgi:protein SMG7